MFETKLKLKQIVRSNNVPSRLFIILAYGKYSHETETRYLTSELILDRSYILDKLEIETTYNNYEWEYTTMSSDSRKGCNTKEFMSLVNKIPFHGMHWFEEEDFEPVTRKFIRLMELVDQYV